VPPDSYTLDIGQWGTHVANGREGSKKKPRRAGPPVGGVSFKIRWERIAAQRPMTRLDRLTSSNLARALHSSCDGHHKKALFIAELR
jgi:hypothetical protein